MQTLQSEADNIRGEASCICETPEEKVVTESVGPLLDLFEKTVPEAFQKEVCLLYDLLLRKTLFSAPLFRILRTGPGRSSMDVHLDGFAFRHQQLESANPCARVSGSVLEYFALSRSGLAKTETCHVLAQANISYSFPRLGQLFRDQYPEGSHNCRHLHSAAVRSKGPTAARTNDRSGRPPFLSFL